jgi:hypothetical protein
MKFGTEPFHRDGQSLDFDLLDFWRWSASDLVSNATRGVLAEYIVARALTISTACARTEWGCYDLITASGIRVEVKSAGFVQSWHQKALSQIQFLTPKRRGWDPQTNVREETPRRHADLYVFALLAHLDKPTIDPLNLTQWHFWIVPTRTLNERRRSQHSITLRSLRELAGEPLDFWHLADAVNRSTATQTSA